MSKKPTVLMILDGYGENPKREHNAIAEADTPVMDKLKAECPYVQGQASDIEIEAKEISLPRFFMNSSVWFQKTNSITLPIAAGADVITINVIVGCSRSTTIVFSGR